MSENLNLKKGVLNQMKKEKTFFRKLTQKISSEHLLMQSQHPKSGKIDREY